MPGLPVGDVEALDRSRREWMPCLIRGYVVFVFQQHQISNVVSGEPQGPEVDAGTRRKLESHRLLHVDLQAPFLARQLSGFTTMNLHGGVKEIECRWPNTQGGTRFRQVWASRRIKTLRRVCC